MACVLFPDRSHHRSSYLISEPYRNWKDATQDLKTHAVCEYHINSAVKLQAFLDTYENTFRRIDLSITEENAKIIQRNREILRSVLKCVEYCGRQGIALRDHRDNDTSHASCPHA